MKKTLVILLSTFMLLVGCSTGNEQVSQSNENGNSKQQASPQESPKKKLVMATSADYKPFEYHDLSGGKDEIVGFDIDVAYALAKELNIDLEIRDMDYTGLLSALQANRVDFVIAGMNPTDERKKNVDFSNKYYTTKFAALAPKGESYTSIQALKGKKVGVQLGTSQEAAAKAANIDTFPLNKFPELVQELKAGRIDVILVEDSVATEYTQANQDLDYEIVTDLPGLDVAAAFPKGSELVDDFNQAIQKLEENGELKKLEEKWFKK